MTLRSPRFAASFLAGAGLLLLQAAEASASCKLPPLALRWTYPANGDTGVPTNAVFWALAGGGRIPVATLDGVELPMRTSTIAEVPLGNLLPNRDYVLKLDYTSTNEPDAGVPQVFEIAFRTGSGPTVRLPAPAVSGDARTLGIDSSTCPDILQAQDCYDTGQNTVLTFDVPDTRDTDWLVGATFWPARCGDPSLYLRAADISAKCFDVRAIGPGGLFSEPTSHCPKAAAAGDAEVSDAGARANTPVAGPTGIDSDAGMVVRDAGLVAIDRDNPEPPGADSCSVVPSTSARGLSVWLLLTVSTVLFRRRRGRAGPSRLRP